MTVIFLQAGLSTDRPPDAIASRSRAMRAPEMRHTRDLWTGRPIAYFALHRAGFTLPPASRPARWALTPPFHPSSPVARRAVCFLWHFPSTRLHARRLDLALTRLGQHSALWCPDFPLRGDSLPRPAFPPSLGMRKNIGATIRPGIGAHPRRSLVATQPRIFTRNERIGRTSGLGLRGRRHRNRISPST